MLSHSITSEISLTGSFLLDGNIRVNQAAREVGYESVSQFNREFKRYFGVTPGSFTNKV